MRVLTQSGTSGNVISVRVWVSSKEAREIRKWAAEKGWFELADRFYRAERAGEYFREPPFLWRWRARHPVLLQCLYCEQWEAVTRHDAKKQGWLWWPRDRVRPAPLARRQRALAKVLALPHSDELDVSDKEEQLVIVIDGWLHASCVEKWERHGASIDKERKARRRLNG